MTIVVMLVIIIINLGNTALEAGIWRKEFITRKETENHMYKDLPIIHPPYISAI